MEAVRSMKAEQARRIGLWAMVRTDKAAHLNPYGIDLDHHLMPDPVASAIACLLERIRLLEMQVGVHGCIGGGSSPEDECEPCAAKQVCEPPIVPGRIAAQA